MCDNCHPVRSNTKLVLSGKILYTSFINVSSVRHVWSELSGSGEFNFEYVPFYY